jgi:adenylate cyclase
MGWAVVSGDGVVSSLTGTPMTVLGDATNVAFRLSGLAGRNRRRPVVVTEAVRAMVAGHWEFADAEVVEVKGRTGRETLYGVR